MITAKPRNMWLPIDSKSEACSVMSWLRNAKRSFMELGGIRLLRQLSLTLEPLIAIAFYGIRQASIAELELADCAVMRAFASALKRMCSLKACASASRWRLAWMMCSSARASRSLLVSWVFRRLITLAALILFKTAIHVFMVGSEESESFSRF